MQIRILSLMRDGVEFVLGIREVAFGSGADSGESEHSWARLGWFVEFFC